MKRKSFMKLMCFPEEWEKWEMYPDQLFKIQIADYSPGSENAPEHFRYGAFLWWFSQSLSYRQKRKIQQLADLDPDQIMAEDIRNRLNG